MSGTRGGDNFEYAIIVHLNMVVGLAQSGEGDRRCGTISQVH